MSARQLAALETALALWAGRDDSLPQPEIRRAASTACDAIDALLELHRIRQQLVSEVRVSDDVATVRTDALSERRRDRSQPHRGATGHRATSPRAWDRGGAVSRRRLRRHPLIKREAAMRAAS